MTSAVGAAVEPEVAVAVEDLLRAAGAGGGVLAEVVVEFGAAAELGDLDLAVGDGDLGVVADEPGDAAGFDGDW